MITKLQRLLRYILIILILLLLGPLWVMATGQVDLHGKWYTADRSSAQLAPNPATTPEAVVQVYAARAYNWRGLFAVHTWVAVKPANAKHYQVYQVIGWRLFRGLSAVSTETDVPDRKWFGNPPVLLHELRGEAAAKVIPQIEQAVKNYPYPNEYRAWPGPNSNTFIAYIARSVPQLGLAMPANAVGKDYLGAWRFIAPATSNTGYQFSLFGVFGVTVAKAEGLQITILGLDVGFNPLKPFVIVPGVGQINLF